MLALPVDVSYTLPETLAALGSKFEVGRNRFHYPFGHGVRADAVLLAWNGEEVDLQGVVREAAHRLYGYRAALWQMRDLARDRLAGCNSGTPIGRRARRPRDEEWVECRVQRDRGPPRRRP